MYVNKYNAPTSQFKGSTLRARLISKQHQCDLPCTTFFTSADGGIVTNDLNPVTGPSNNVNIRLIRNLRWGHSLPLKIGNNVHVQRMHCICRILFIYTNMYIYIYKRHVYVYKNIYGYAWRQAYRLCMCNMYSHNSHVTEPSMECHPIPCNKLQFFFKLEERSR